MADFVWVLKRQIGKHSEPSSELRKRIYDHAREALAKKLADYSPPLSADVISKQKRSLEDAVSGVEREFAGRRPLPEDPLAELEAIFSSIDRNPSPPPPLANGPGRRGRPATKPDVIDFDEDLAILFDEADTPEGTRSQPTAGSMQAEAGKVEIKASEAHFSFGGPNRTALGPRRRRTKPPQEPQIIEGPEFEVRDGKLASIPKAPGSFSEKSQSELHRQLRGALADSAGHFAKVENKFPELARAVKEYTSLLEPDTTEINIFSVYSVGTSLIAFGDAYREQNALRTLAEPLEPQTAAALQSISRIHAAFIMGFEEGVDLVRKSNEFMLDAQRIQEIEGPGSTLLANIVTNPKLVEEATVAANKPISDYVRQYGWQGSRAGFAAYVSVRNAVIAAAKFLMGDLSVAGVINGGIALTALVAPNIDFVRTVLPILRANAADLLVFFNHSPELRAYIEWVIDVLERDGKQ